MASPCCLLTVLQYITRDIGFAGDILSDTWQTKTNAARASHPSRIVIANVLTVALAWRFRARTRSHRATALRRALCIRRCLWGLRLRVAIPRLPSFSKERRLRRPLGPGTGTLDMHRIPPDDSLSRNHRQRGTSVRTDPEHLTL